jgi:hypothetical protein
VPVLAAGLADVLVVDANPRIRSRIGGHPLDQIPVRLLDHGVVVEVRLHFLDASGEAVPNLLQLVDREQTGPAHPRNGEVDALARKSRAEQPGERELHCGDLAAQVSACVALIMLVENAVEALRRDRRQQILLGCDRHLGKVNALE